MFGFLAFIALCLIIGWVIKSKNYEKTEYYANTGHSYWKVRHDVGLYGEYLIYENLKRLEGNRKFLFNCYIPKNNGTTSEIDVILIHSSGIYVFESKNYSGWIFGSQSQKTWTQTFPNGRKERFFNPIMQNNSHIKWLKNILPDISDKSFRSVIAFSDRCELKKVDFDSNKHLIINRCQVLPAISGFLNQQILSDTQIEKIYQTLHPYTQVSDDIRASHIASITNQITQQSNSNIVAISLAPNLVAENRSILNNQVEANSEKITFCAKCGSEMKIRIAKRGNNRGKQFLGCSNYPKCRNTVDI